MKKLIKIFFILALVMSNSPSSMAMLGEAETEVKYKEMKATGFTNYPPFGQSGQKKPFESLFESLFKQFEKEKGFFMDYKLNNNHKESVQNVRTGNIDFIVGMYNATDLYKGIDFIYPAAVINPVHIITLPNRTNEIEQIKDVQGLKGAIHSNEHMSDYANKQLDKFNLQRIDNSYELYEKLFKGEIDYIFSSRYFAMIETSKLGIKNKISFSKKPIWVMPLFFGVSKSYQHRKLVTQYLGLELKKPEVKEKINNYLIEMINNVERENTGIVPPTFVTEQK